MLQQPDMIYKFVYYEFVMTGLIMRVFPQKKKNKLFHHIFEKNLHLQVSYDGKNGIYWSSSSFHYRYIISICIRVRSRAL